MALKRNIFKVPPLQQLPQQMLMKTQDYIMNYLVGIQEDGLRLHRKMGKD